MEFLNELEALCKRFIRKEFDIIEFQGRIERLIVPDGLNIPFNKKIQESSNILEEIRFCSLEENFYKHGIEVANTLLEEIKKNKI